MQLGKLNASQSKQELSCKPPNEPVQAGQWLTLEKQNSKPHQEEPRSSAELQDDAAGTLEGFRRLNTFNTLSDKSQQNHHPRTNDFLLLSERVVERDDGMFELWPRGQGPFPTRAFAEAVRARMNRYDSKWRAA